MSIRGKKILVADNSKPMVEELKEILINDKFNMVRTTNSGIDVLKIEKSWNPDIIIMDTDLPDIDGFEVCKRIRNTSMVPVIFLSPKSDEVSKVISFAMGGDDFIVKPFYDKELLARIKAILKRQEYYNSVKAKQRSVSFGPFRIDFQKRELYNDSNFVELTNKEYKLLEYLVENRGVTVGKESIIQDVWGYDFDGDDNTIMVHIRHLRKKIETEPSNPTFIKTVKGRGYRFEIAS